MITKTLIREGNLLDKKGYCFEVYFNNNQYPNIISALFKTELGTKRKLNKYLKDGSLDYYGNAE